MLKLARSETDHDSTIQRFNDSQFNHSTVAKMKVKCAEYHGNPGSCSPEFAFTQRKDHVPCWACNMKNHRLLVLYFIIGLTAAPSFAATELRVLFLGDNGHHRPADR